MEIQSQLPRLFRPGGGPEMEKDHDGAMNWLQGSAGGHCSCSASLPPPQTLLWLCWELQLGRSVGGDPLYQRKPQRGSPRNSALGNYNQQRGTVGVSIESVNGVEINAAAIHYRIGFLLRDVLGLTWQQEPFPLDKEQFSTPFSTFIATWLSLFHSLILDPEFILSLNNSTFFRCFSVYLLPWISLFVCAWIGLRRMVEEKLLLLLLLRFQVSFSKLFAKCCNVSVNECLRCQLPSQPLSVQLNSNSCGCLEVEKESECRFVCSASVEEDNKHRLLFRLSWCRCCCYSSSWATTCSSSWRCGRT